MLTRIIKNATKINLKRMQMFGSSGHHNHQVHIDKNATWIKYSSNRKLMSIDGFIDTHYQMPGVKTDNPYQHLDKNGVFSMENLVYNDPYYHDPQHQLHVTQPHGYLGGEDPLQARNDIMAPTLTGFMILIGICLGVFYFWSGTSRHEKEIDRLVSLKYEIEARLKAKSQQIEQLQDEVDSIQKQLHN